MAVIRRTLTVPPFGSGSIRAAFERYGRRSSAATPAETTPPPPSDVSKPVSTRSYVSSLSAAARTWTVDLTPEPASAGSVTRTPRVAPIASALRIVSAAPDGAIVRSVTSPPCSAVSLRAASRAYSSLPFTTAGEAARSRRPSGPRRSAAAAGSGTGLVRTTMCTRAGPP